MFEIDNIPALIALLLKTNIPPWKFDEFKRLKDALQVHTKGIMFSKIDTVFPNESPASKQHCVNTYEPITLGSAWKAINDIIRIFSNSSFSLTASELTSDWLSQNTFDNTNFLTWFLNRWTNQAIALDANSFFGVYPDEYLQDWGGDSVRFIGSEYLQYVSDNVICFKSPTESKTTEKIVSTIETWEDVWDADKNITTQRKKVVKSYVQRYEKEIVKAVYHAFTKDYLIRFYESDTQKGEYTFDIYEYKRKGQILCFPVGGKETYSEIFDSFLSPFIPFGNECLYAHRNQRAVDLMFSYPRMSEIEQACDNSCKLNAQTGKYMSRGEVCQRCKGTGVLSIQSPYKTYVKKLGNVTGGPSDPDLTKLLLQTPPVEFMTPDIGILKMANDAWQSYLTKAEEAVFVVQDNNSAVGESADRKRLDYEGKFAWLLNISKTYFAALRNAAQARENYTLESAIDIVVEEPRSFAILSEEDAYTELNTIIASGAPIYLKAQQVENFITKFVSKSSPIVRAIEVLKSFDPYLFYSDADLIVYKSNNIMKPEMWTNHTLGYPLLIKMLKEDKTLFDKEDSVIISKLQSEIAKFAPEQSNDLKNNLLNNLNS